MDQNVFKYVLRYSKREQVMLLLVIVVSLPFYYASLELPKTIINQAIGGSDFPKELAVLGIDTGLSLQQLPYLWILCGIFLTLVFINGAFKYFVNVFRGILSERMLRRLRYQLIQRVARFPLPHFRNVSSGALVSMVTAEAEPLGGFAGESFSLPAHQGGLLLTLLAFMFVQDPILGLAAVALYPLQAYVIPKLQRRVNALGKERVRNVRMFSEQMGELVSGAGDIHAHGTAQYELAGFTDRLGNIFDIRFDIYRKKFFIKFLNNFLAQLTPFFFFSLGGYLVIVGDLTLGALVAVLAAYKDLSAPWKELLTFYQRLEDARIKYGQLVEQFNPPGMIDEDLIEPPAEPIRINGKQVSLNNVSLEEDEGTKVVNGATFTVKFDQHVALSGPDGGGRSEVARIMARQLLPTGGQITFGDSDFLQLPENVTGRELAYVDNESYIRSGTVRDNLLYALKRQPTRTAELAEDQKAERERRLREAIASGNSAFDLRDDWIDYEALGSDDAANVTRFALRALDAVQLGEDVFQIGLRRVIRPADHPELVERVLEARKRVRERLADDPHLAGLVEVFDVTAFNSNASVAENILFGTPLDRTFDVEHLGRNQHVLETLRRVGLIDRFPELGRSIASLMVELFRDLPPGHEFFERFSFIQADDLAEYQRILNHCTNKGINTLSPEDLSELIELPFLLVHARHRLGLIDEELEHKFLEARRVFAETLPDSARGSIAFFDATHYNAAISIQDNILFGKVASHKAESSERIGELVAEVIEELDIRGQILEVGLEFDVGIGGKRLSSAQRQKLAIARCLIKQPRLLIVNEATQGLNAQVQEDVFKGVKSFMEGRGLIWVQSEVNGTQAFDRILAVEKGRATEAATVSAGDAAVGETPGADTPEEQASGSGLALQTEVLAGIPFFAGMDRSKLKLLAFTSEEKTFQSGQDLLRQGDMGDNALVILEGTADIIVDTAHGPTTVAQMRRGALIGELALLCDTPRTATVRAVDNVAALSISKDIFFQLIQENAAVALNLTRIVADRLATTMRDLSNRS